MKQFAVAVRTGYTYASRFRPVVFEVETITPRCVFAAGFWNRATRYKKADYKFQFFDSKEDADNAAYMINFRCGVLDAERAQTRADELRKIADEKVQKELLSWG